MKEVVNSEKYGEIVYEEGFWLGRKTVSISGTPLTKVAKNQYRLPDGSVAMLKGSFLTGVSLAINGEVIQLIPKPKWYEYVLGVLPFVLVLIWGNVPALCKIVPIVGGAIGGFVGAFAGVISITGMRNTKRAYLKIIIGIAATALTFFVCYLIAIAILAVLA